MNFFQKLFGRLQSSHTDEASVTRAPEGKSKRFAVVYGKLPIGELEVKDGQWQYHYSEAFRSQNQLRPLVGFPDLDKEYKNEDLWPFFASRIPSLATPHVAKRVKKKHLDPNDAVQMLTEFGRRTITNPFELVPQE